MPNIKMITQVINAAEIKHLFYWYVINCNASWL